MSKKFEIIEEVPIDVEVIDTLNEFERELATFNSADEWVNGRGYVIAHDSDDRRPITHVGLNGLSISVPFGREALYDQFLARDLQRQKVNYICECITPRCFQMFGDIDMLSATKLSDARIKEMALTYQNAAKRFYPESKNDFSMGVYMTDVTKLAVQYEDESSKGTKTVDLYKYGFHFVFVSLKVNVVRALYIAHMALALFNLNFPAPKFPENSWEERNDFGVLKPRGGGLRKFGSHKILDCPKCSKQRKSERRKLKAASSSDKPSSSPPERGGSAMPKGRPRRKKCEYCNSTSGRIEGGRPYKTKWMINSDGEIDEAKTKDMITDYKFAFAWSSIRCPDPKDTISPGYVRPDNCPSAPKAEYYMEQMCLQENDLSEDKRRKIQSNILMLENSKLLETAQNSSEVKKRRTTNRAKDASMLKKLYECEDNYETIQKKYKERIYLAPDSPLIPLIQQAIRSMHTMYKDILVTHIFHNRRKSHFVVIVDGIGSNYCLNKGANHTSANIYFYINKYNQLAHMCMSTKPIVRKTCKCSDFASFAIDVPAWTATQLKWDDKKSGIGNGTLQDMIECNIFRKNIHGMYEITKKKKIERLKEKHRSEIAERTLIDKYDKKIEKQSQDFHHHRLGLEFDDLSHLLFNNGRILFAAGKIEEKELPPKGDLSRLMYEADTEGSKKYLLEQMKLTFNFKQKLKPLKLDEDKRKKSPKKKKAPDSSSRSDSDSLSDGEPPAKRQRLG